MRLALLADEKQYAELMRYGSSSELEIIRIGSPAVVEEADIYMDLLFDNTPERILAWAAVLPSLLIIGAVEFSAKELKPPFVIINHWPGFLERNILEAGGPDDAHDNMKKLAGLLNRRLEWVKQVPGLVSARVISMIINEAFFTIEEGVTDEFSIDTAMKLGTNYPYGPFEWAEKIGLKRICRLLELLAEKEDRYHPADLLRRRAYSL